MLFCPEPGGRWRSREVEYQWLPESRGGEIRLQLNELRGFYYGGNLTWEMGQRLLLWAFESEDERESARAISDT